MIQIRYADFEDYELIMAIDDSIDKGRFLAWTQNRQVIIALVDGQLAGWLQYSLFIEKLPFINRLYLFEKYQRQGIGTGMVKFWECEMLDKGYSQLMLSTEKTNSALEFYKKLGYKELGSFDYFTEHTELLLGKTVTIEQFMCHCKR